MHETDTFFVEFDSMEMIMLGISQLTFTFFFSFAAGAVVAVDSIDE